VLIRQVLFFEIALRFKLSLHISTKASKAILQWR